MKTALSSVPIQFNSILEISKGQVIVIEGKTLCGAKSKGIKSPVIMVSAWANENKHQKKLYPK